MPAQPKVNIVVDHVYRLGAGALMALIAYMGNEMRDGIDKNTAAINRIEVTLTNVNHLERRLQALEAKEEKDAQSLRDRVREAQDALGSAVAPPRALAR